MTTVITRDERQLLANVARYLRTHGWILDHGGARHAGAGLAADWSYEERIDGKRRRSLEVCLINGAGYTERTTLEGHVTTVQDAIDLASAIGILPAHLTSAYRAGFAVGYAAGQATGGREAAK